MKKSFIALGLTAAALLASCGTKQIKINPDKEKYVVGICQLVQHEALDAATKGFKDKLTSELASRNRQVEILEKVGSGDASDCASIVNTFVASDVDLIMANATAALQAAFTATETIPVLATSITEYSVATGLKMSDGKSGTNISGTSDIASISDQVDLMVKLLQDSGKPINKVGILYCSSEANSDFQVKEATKFFEAKNIAVTKYSFAGTEDIQSVCNSIVGNVDAVYVPTDNIVANNKDLVRANVTDKGVPVFAGEAGICKGCGFATLSIDYYRLGEVTGKMAAEILTGEKDITTYEIQYDTNPTKMYNKDIADALGISIPEGFEQLVIEEE